MAAKSGMRTSKALKEGEEALAENQGQDDAGTQAQQRAARAGKSPEEIREERPDTDQSQQVSTPENIRSSKAPKSVDVNNHSFAPGDKISVFPQAQVEVEIREDRAPSGESSTTATVDKDGSLSVSGLEKGTYVAVSDGDSKKSQVFSVK